MSTTAEDESEPGRTTRRRRRRPKLSVGQSIGVAGGFVSLVGGVVTLLFLFVPGCQPKAPADEGSAEITNVRIERGITFGQYLVRSSLPRGSISHKYLDRRGVLVRFHYVAHGFRGKALPLETQLINDDTHDLIGGTERGISIKLETNNEARDWYVWRAVPRTKATYHVVVTLLQPDGQMPVRTFDTDPFPGLGV